MNSQRLVTILTLALLTAGSGCASIQVRTPWDVDRAVGPETETTAGSPENDREGDEGDETNRGKEPEQEPIARASYWARHAVGASREYASAEVWRALRTDRAVASGNADSDQTGEKTSANSNSESPSESDPNFESLARNDEAESSESGDTEATAERSDDATSSEQTTANVRRAGASTSESTRPKSLDWPLTLSDSSGTGVDAIVDPSADAEILSLDDEDVRSRLADEYGLEDLPDSEHAVAVEGTFSNVLDDMQRLELSDEALESQLAVVDPGRSVAFYAGSHRVARAEFDEIDSLPEPLREVHPIRAVDDGTLQLVFYWGDTESDAESVEYRVGVLKLVGARVGRTFQRTVAVRPKEGADLQRKGYLAFLQGRDHRRLQWTPADDSGEPETSDATVLHWNKWEGVFRPPGPPPTAPEQRT